MRGARAALAFLTRLPTGPLESEDFSRAPGWFAAIGILIGCVMAGGYWIGATLWGETLGAILAVVLGLMITGALHEDGLADAFDGLGSGRPAERALEIMRDSRIGSFGALALGLVMGARIVALAGLGPLAPAALIAGQALSRASMALLLRLGPYLRATGAGTGMTGPMGASAIAGILAVVAAVALVFWSAKWAILGGVFGLAFGVWGIRAWAIRRLGGVTGDIFGAAQVLGDLGFLLGLLACL